jgi:hypothetical protein
VYTGNDFRLAVVGTTVIAKAARESFVNHICRQCPLRVSPSRQTDEWNSAMRGITFGVVATLLGTMAYVLIAVALASAG